MQIIVKKYEHFNTSLPNWTTPKGVYVKSKDHYDRLCKESGMVPYEKIEYKSNRKEYTLSHKAKEIIKAASQVKDKKGNVKLGDRTIDAMKSIGAIRKISDWNKHLPSNYQKVGGFV